MLPCSWITTSRCFAPVALSLEPAPLPAICSVWPTCVIAPNFLKTSRPELSVMNGIFAFLARAKASFIASGFGTDVAMPLTFCSTAVSTSCSCLFASLLLSLYLTVIPRSLPAADAPLCATAQNVSPEPCVMTAIFSDFGPRALRPVAAAATGEPSRLRPAAARPPLTKRSRRETCINASSVSLGSRSSLSKGSLVIPISFCRTMLRRFSPIRGASRHPRVLDSHRAPLRARPRRCEGDRKRCARVVQAAWACLALEHRRDESGQLGSIGAFEALDEVAVTVLVVARAAGLDGTKGRPSVEPDDDAVLSTKDLETDVVPERIVPR